MAALQPDDWIASTYRCHGHAIAKGVSLERMAAELYGRRTGVSKGKGGSMHISDFDKGMLGAFGIVAAGIPVAVGAALTAQMKDTGQISVAFFGDGAVHQGVFHEGAGLAKLWGVPVLLVCENNQYAEATALDYHLNTETIADMACAYAMPAERADGMDVVTVFETTRRRRRAGSRGRWPHPFRVHLLPLFGTVRRATPKPINPPRRWPVGASATPSACSRSEPRSGGSRAGRLERIQHEVEETVTHAFETAEDAPFPDPEETLDDVYVSYPSTVEKSIMRELTVKDAINEALFQAMEADPDIVLMGEDIAGGAGRDEHSKARWTPGGVPLGVTQGLATRFGRAARARHDHR